jgi:hypothetical protein
MKPFLLFAALVALLCASVMLTEAGTAESRLARLFAMADTTCDLQLGLEGCLIVGNFSGTNVCARDTNGNNCCNPTQDGNGGVCQATAGPNGKCYTPVLDGACPKYHLRCGYPGSGACLGSTNGGTGCGPAGGPGNGFFQCE